MIISENWLREWVDFDASFEDLPKLLTQVGLEAGAVSVGTIETQAHSYKVFCVRVFIICPKL